MSMASARTPRIPGPDHPITIERNPKRIVVKYAGRVIVDTTDALTLREAGYAPVHYIPRRHADMTAMEPSAHTTYCPYKGDCSYYSLVVGDKRSDNAVWTYLDPYAAVAGIKDHLAFYPNRVDSITEEPA
jgi:uncharacterized protein (DUF427 family)